MLRPATISVLLAALPASAETLLSEASGNWAGASNQGFHFLARLTQEEDLARLRIWSSLEDGVPSGAGDPDLDNGQVALSAFATLQALEVVETENGSVLHVITEFADEYAVGRNVVKIQLIDSQYTVIGYDYQEVAHDGTAYDCLVDFQNGQMVEDGMEYAVGVDSGVTNASSWTYSIVFERSVCSVD